MNTGGISIYSYICFLPICDYIQNSSLLYFFLQIKALNHNVIV